MRENGRKVTMSTSSAEIIRRELSLRGKWIYLRLVKLIFRTTEHEEREANDQSTEQKKEIGPGEES